MSGRRSPRGEHGFTLVELVVSLALGMIVILGILTVTEVVMRSSARTATRVDANQRARPVLERLIDELHSTCIGPEAGPMLAGSTESSLGFLHQTGQQRDPAARQASWSRCRAARCRDRSIPSTGGEAPNWTFAGTPSSTRVLLTGVGPAQTGDPPIDVPLFRYFNVRRRGRRPRPRCQTPLDAATLGARRCRSTVAFSVAPLSNPTNDARAPITVSDSVLVRFSPASEDPTKVNGPCV